MAPLQEEMLCDGWLWDPVLKELRHYRKKGKGWADAADASERLRPVKSVTWYRWSQAPMATATGQAMPSKLSRVVAAYEGGGDLTLNENDRICAERLARAIADGFGLQVIEAGAPSGRKSGNLPQRDGMGRLVCSSGRLQVTLDESTGEITRTKARFPIGKSRRVLSTREVRRLELGYEVKGAQETFTVFAVAGPEEERLPVAGYRGYEGWADPEEWWQFTRELARGLGVEPARAEGSRH